MPEDEDDKDKHLKQLAREDSLAQREKDEHLKKLDKEHTVADHEKDQHLARLEKEFQQKIQLEEALKRGAGKSAKRCILLLDSRSVEDQLAEINTCSRGNLGRDVQDYLTGRQHHWDRASQGPEHAGFGDR